MTHPIPDEVDTSREFKSIIPPDLLAIAERLLRNFGSDRALLTGAIAGALSLQRERIPLAQLSDEVCDEAAGLMIDAWGVGDDKGPHGPRAVMRGILTAERDRAASIAEEYGRPDIAAKIRGEA